MRILSKCLVIFASCLSAATVQAGDVKALLSKLKSADADERRSAAKELADMGPDAKDATAALVTALKSDKDTFVRRFSAQALGEIEADPKVAVPALTAALKDDHKELVEAAVTSLGKMGEPAVPALISVLKNKSDVPDKVGKKAPTPTDPTALVRTKAIEALGNMGPKAKSAVPVLSDALKDMNVRIEAANALGNIGPDAKDAVTALEGSIGAKGGKKDKAFTKAVNDALKKIKA